MRGTNWPSSGQLLGATGILHTLVGVWTYRQPLGQMLGGGLWGTVPDDLGTGAAALWFLVAGLLMVALGALYHFVEVGLGHTLPTQAGVYLLLIAAFSVVLMPANGAWFIIPQALLIIVRARRRTPAVPSAAT